MTPIVGISFLESMIYILKNKKELKNIDIEKQRVRVKKYKRSSIYSAIILGFLLVFIFFYTRPDSIYKIIALEGIDKIEGVYTWESTSETDKNHINEDNIEKLFDVLDNYKYKIPFNYRKMDGIGEFFSVLDKDGGFRRVEVWEKGYLRLHTGEVYKIESENREDLYEDLTEEMKKWK